jgi:hypothetical protein
VETSFEVRMTVGRNRCETGFDPRSGRYVKSGRSESKDMEKKEPEVGVC